jgi:hypothetical protein
MAQILSPLPVQRFVDNNGNALVGGQLFTFQAGSNTPAQTFTDSSGVTTNPNPIILNSRGECQIWLPPNVAFKFQLLDSFSNTIWTVDNIVNSQLITLWGGVDTGSANSYSLNFLAPFTSYLDGTVLYWNPANTNTGASTININGLGVINLASQAGNSLVAGQIVANQVTGILINGGVAYVITSPAATSLYISNASTGEIGVILAGLKGNNLFSAIGGVVPVTVSGVTGVSTINCGYTLNMNKGTLFMPCFSGTSSATSFSMTLNQPNLFTPTNRPQWFMLPSAQDNGANIYSQTGTVQNIGSPATAMQITFYKNGNAAGWTASGTKGVGDAASVSGAFWMPLSWIVSGAP